MVRPRHLHRPRLRAGHVDRAGARPRSEPHGRLLVPALGAAGADRHRHARLGAGHGTVHGGGLRARRARARVGLRALLHAPPARDHRPRGRRRHGRRADRSRAAAARAVRRAGADAGARHRRGHLHARRFRRPALRPHHADEHGEDGAAPAGLDRGRRPRFRHPRSRARAHARHDRVVLHAARARPRGPRGPLGAAAGGRARRDPRLRRLAGRRRRPRGARARPLGDLLPAAVRAARGDRLL